MPRSVNLLPAALRQLKKLPIVYRPAAEVMIAALGDDNQFRKTIRLSSNRRMMRMKQGSLRLVFSLEDDHDVTVHEIKPRKDSYRR